MLAKVIKKYNDMRVLFMTNLVITFPCEKSKYFVHISCQSFKRFTVYCMHSKMTFKKRTEGVIFSMNRTHNQ